MAEFKLGRIRFVWKDEWQTSTVYYRDDVIRFGGRLYICVIGHTSASDFYSDLDITPSKWNLVADGQNWKGNWDVNTDYVYNDIVKYGANLYIANTIHTSAATIDLGLEADVNKWDVFGTGLDWKGNWSTSTRYKVNDLVKYGGITYVCNTAHTSAATDSDGLETDQAKWDEFNKGIEYKGEWTTTPNRYKVNDVVKFGPALYICVTEHTSTADFETDSANWSMFVEGLEQRNEWSPFEQYAIGDIVQYGGWQFVSKTIHTGSVPSTSDADWDVLTKGFNFRGDWGDDSSAQDYRVGDVVRVGGYTYVAIADSNNQEPPNALFWERLNSGFNWRGEWVDDFVYVIGDVVRYGSNSYVCIQGHISEGDDFSTVTTLDPGGGNANSRPDLDTAGTYWNIMTIGSETSVLSVKGDLVYYGGAGPTRLPVGQKGQILRVSNNSEPEWAFLGQNPDVYYVATHGIDSPAPVRGTTLDQPWKSVRYACEQIEHGTKNPNARRLLELNRAFIQRETVEYVDYNITNSVAPYVGLTYQETSCERDVGLIIDAIIWDITHGGNVKSREAALKYVNEASNFYTLDQEEVTVDAIEYALTLMENVLNQTAPNTDYQTTNGDNSTAIVEQWTDSSIEAESGVLTEITSLVNLITDAITAGNDDNIPAKIEVNTLIKVATGQYYEVLPISVPAGCCVMGDELRATTVSPKTENLTPRNDVGFSFQAITRLEEIIGDVVTGNSVSSTTGNTELQVIEWPYGDTQERNATEKLARVIRKNIDFAIGDKLEKTLTKTYDMSNTNKGYARDNILINKEFLKAEVTAYIDNQYPNLKYSRTKCKQDVGYIIDAISYDLTYGGNWQSTNAGLAYFDGNSGTLQIDSTEKTATIDAYAFLKSILQTVARNITVTPTYQNNVTQISVPNATDIPTTVVIGSLIDSITAIINNGPSAASITYPDISSVPEALVSASNNLNDAKTTIATNTIDFISKNFGSFKYDSAKCRRDLRLIMNDISYGAAFGSNFNAVQNGIAYTRANAGVVSTTQLTETVGALNYAKTLVNESVTTDGSSATGSSTFATRTDAAFDEIIDILENGTSAADAITYPDHAGLVQNRKDAKDNLVANKQFLIDNLVGYINNQISGGTPPYNGFSYDQAKCERDTGYIIDALAYDIMYEGTLGTSRVAQSYFVDGVIQIAGQEAQHVDALTYLASVIEDVVQEQDVTPTYTATAQTKPGTPATSSEATELTNKITIITNAINDGDLDNLPAIVYPDISAESAELQDANSNLQSDIEDIIPQVIQYINTTYNDFNYNQEKCSRDIGLIIDAARYDWMLGSNFASIVAAYSYLRRPSLNVLKDQKEASLAAFEYARQQAVQYVNSNATAITGINNTWEWIDDILFGGSSEGNNDVQPLFNPHAAVRLLELNKDYITSELHAYIADYYKDTVTDTNGVTNEFTISSTEWLKQNMAVKFTSPDDSTTSISETGVNLVEGNTYYVREITSDTTFTVSSTIGGAEIDVDTTSAQFIVQSAYEYSIAACSRDISAYINAIKYDMIYPSKWKREYTDGVMLYYPAAYKTRLAARYYANSVLGSQEEDMYYLRNATGLRLQTLTGLNGDLSPANAYGTSRPTAGAYASLDPGWGPDDQHVWITARSPYVQNVTTFGNGAVGQKIDGALHNGGNDSIVSNDFTQVISDGIGAWITNNGRAELVSVFTYYAHIGYLAEAGGRIRATNGNNSYGTFGSVAEGVDSTETPVTAIVDNRLQFNATISNVPVDGDKVINLEFNHAGNDYTDAVINVFGSGTGAETIADEFRDDAVNRVRILELNDSSGQLGGDGYVIVANTAQTGTTTSLTLAATDGNPDSAYPGMKVYITGGAGVGQYGTIASYNSGAKLATVLKNDGTSGWEHLNPGTPIVAPNSSSTYQIEPSVTFSAPPFNNTANTLGTSLSATDMNYCLTAVQYTGISTTTNSVFGSGATFNIIRNGSKYYVTLDLGGTRYQRNDTVTILGTDVGGTSPTNDITITVTSVNSTTGAIVKFDFNGIGLAGSFIAVGNATSTYLTSTDGTTWTSNSLSGTAPTGTVQIANGLLDDGSSILKIGATVIVGQNSLSGNQIWYDIDGTLNNFTQVAIPGGPYNSNPHIAFGDNKFVIIFENSDSVFESGDGGATWTQRLGALPSTGFTGLTYGAGRFVAVKGTTTTAVYANSNNLASWTTTALPGTSAWVDIAYGKNRFVAISSDDNKAAYSLDRGATWIDADMPDQDGSSVNNYVRIKYGQGVFVAIADNGAVGDLEAYNYIQTSEDGVNWINRGISPAGSENGYDAIAFGNPNQTGQWIVKAQGSNQDIVNVELGCQALGRAGVASDKIFEIRLVEPGSGYTNGAPTIIITDPNNIFDVETEVRLGKGSLANPSFTNRGSGYQSASAEISALESDGFADFFQTGTFIAVRRLSQRPVSGSNVVFDSLPNQVFKLVNTISFLGDTDGSYTAFLNISPEMTVSDSPEDGDPVTMRIRYSQVRLTGHDFLDIGTGNATTTNYPGTPLQDPDQDKETQESNGGRVFFTATDQDGNFRVGNLFSVEQSTGIATLNAEAFNIAGLQELSLGEVTLGGNSASITEFSTDPFFTANSDTIVPTQRAIKSYIEAQIGGGGASLNVNTVTAGDIFIGTNTITTVAGEVINIRATTQFTGGVTGIPIAINYFLR